MVKIFQPGTIAILLLMVFNVLNNHELRAQKTASVENDWIEHLKTGNAKKLSSRFNELISIELINEKGNFGKSHAVMLLSDFFKQHPADSIAIRQEGHAGANNHFYIGDYFTHKTVLRLYVVSNLNQQNELIHIFNITRK